MIKLTQLIKIPFLIFCSLLLLSHHHLYGKPTSQEEIIVRLSIETPLIPVFIFEIDSTHSIFPRDFSDSLKKIIEFDFNHNGMTRVILPNKLQHIQDTNKQIPFDAVTPFTTWKKEHIFYLFKFKIIDAQLSVQIISVNSQNHHTLEGIQLSGDIRKDRAIAHQIADKIHQLLFDKPGIASTHIIYAHKMQVTDKRYKQLQWSSEIFEMDYDGANPQQLTQNLGFCITPCYIPPKPGTKSTSFCFVSYKIGQPKIYYGSLKNPSFKRLTTLRGNQLTPAISRDRSQVAFISDVTSTADLFLLPFQIEKSSAEKPMQIFAAQKTTQASPSFSPDGKKIAFVSNKDGSPKIYVMNVPQSPQEAKHPQLTLITKKNRENTSPAWSPDGKKIAYSAQTQGIRQIWIYDCETQQERQLTQGPKNKENPNWAPNSLHLVFNANSATECDIYIMNLNQSETVKISNGSGEKRYPAWEIR